MSIELEKENESLKRYKKTIISCLEARKKSYYENTTAYKELQNTIDMLNAECYNNVKQFNDLDDEFLTKFKTSKTAVLLTTKEAYQEFCNWLCSNEIKWTSGYPLKSKDNLYEINGKNTCLLYADSHILEKVYNDATNQGLVYADLSYFFNEPDYTIVEYNANNRRV